MTSKSFSNIQKLAAVAACIRETLEYIDNNSGLPDARRKSPVSFRVQAIDVKTAREIVHLSIHTYKSFKVWKTLGNNLDSLLLSIVAHYSQRTWRIEGGGDR